jgi:hypothetical protein
MKALQRRCESAHGRKQVEQQQRCCRYQDAAAHGEEHDLEPPWEDEPATLKSNATRRTSLRRQTRTVRPGDRRPALRPEIAAPIIAPAIMGNTVGSCFGPPQDDRLSRAQLDSICARLTLGPFTSRCAFVNHFPASFTIPQRGPNRISPLYARSATSSLRHRTCAPYVTRLDFPNPPVCWQFNELVPFEMTALKQIARQRRRTAFGRLPQFMVFARAAATQPTAAIEAWTADVDRGAANQRCRSSDCTRPVADGRVTPKQTSQEQGFGVPGRRWTDTTPH